MKLLDNLRAWKLRVFQDWMWDVQSKIENLLQKDKLEHYFVMSILVLPISLIWKCWWLTLLISVVGASLKEFIDVKFRNKTWSWLDWAWGVMGGVVVM